MKYPQSTQKKEQIVSLFFGNCT